MNGALSAAHAALEESCTSCHQPWSGVPPEQCLDCHGPVVLGTNHAAVEQQCSTCHREHQGRTHLLTHIAPHQCRRCHEEILMAGQHPRQTAEQCLLCHGQHAPATFARAVKSDLIMPHSIHVRDPGPVKAPCELCHHPAAEPALIRYPLEPVCRKCHTEYIHDTTKDIRSRECLLCHDADHVVTLRRAAGFATLRFSHATHQAFACQECHAEMDLMTSLAEIPLPGVETCTKCH
jgi:predicted CXXCH cytochrome family protein